LFLRNDAGSGAAARNLGRYPAAGQIRSGKLTGRTGGPSVPAGDQP
jgi:hypothetical protein